MLLSPLQPYAPTPQLVHKDPIEWRQIEADASNPLRPAAVELGPITANHRKAAFGDWLLAVGDWLIVL